VSPETPVAYVLGTFPQASQTFIAREVRGLRALGVPLIVFALARRPPDALEPADRGWYSDVRFVPFFLAPAVAAANVALFVRSPGRYASTFVHLVALPHRPRLLALRAIALFMVAAWIARAIQRAGGCRRVHAHFALAQTEVAMAVSGLLGIPFSFTAHARDIYATPSALADKMRAAACVVTCTAYNAQHLRRVCPDLPAEHVQLVHHGVDVDAAARAAGRCTPPPDATVPIILAAGRLIEKKGFDTLVRACRLLADRGVAFECRIYGDGPLAGELQQDVERQQLSGSVALLGWAAAETLQAEMERAAAFTMPSRVSRSGDRDGIPNVVLEAMAAGVPVVATAVSGIPEAIVHETTGLLVAADDSEALANGLQRVLQDRALAARLTAAARARVTEEFGLDVASRRLATLFSGAPPAPPPGGASESGVARTRT
jgi:glycosyltransferase involved in cell wall biosynthesis